MTVLLVFLLLVTSPLNSAIKLGIFELSRICGALLAQAIRRKQPTFNCSFSQVER